MSYIEARASEAMTDQKKSILARRRFLGGMLGMAGVSLTSGVTLFSVGEAKAVSGKVRWGMLIDINKCGDGCDDCVTACAKENGICSTGRPESDPQWIRKIDLRDPKSGATKSLPMMCQHCAEPPCVDVCPTGASFKRADGIVLVDKHTCIGCRYCMMACPYKARSFVHEDITDQKSHAPRGKGTVESCTLCVHRIDAGGSPACVEACSDSAGGAMLFGDLNDQSSEISKRVAKYATRQIRADLGLDPGVRYRGL
jgi:tetrathionate reductase subunit B